MAPKKTGFPEPLVIPPLQLPHKHTLIILHGRGSSADKFGPTLLEAPFTLPTATTTSSQQASEPNPSSTTTTLAQTFPHARFVFPTAARRRATIYGRSLTNQWFDNWKLDPPTTEREELMAPGLRETVTHVHALLRAEIAAVPGGNAKNVVLAGLSQGCAASLVSLLLWEGQAIGGVFGMCGWLPYGWRLGGLMEGGGDDGGTAGEDDDDPFERDGSNEGDDDPFERGGSDGEDEADAPTRAINYLREEIDLEWKGSEKVLVSREIPVFLGHGVDDDRVGVVLGRKALNVLNDIGVQAEWKEYEGLGHWYSDEMLRDIVLFLRSKTGWQE